MRKVHGSTKNRGSRPSHHVDASGSVDRKVMQALENIGVLEKDEERGGRRITQSGQRDLDRMSTFFCKAYCFACAYADFLCLMQGSLKLRWKSQMRRRSSGGEVFRTLRLANVWANCYSVLRICIHSSKLE